MSHGKRAFTIVELMVVMIIIAVVVSILIPALGHARGAARDASTQGLMNNIVSAAGKFEQDNRRHPGHFSARDMGGTENETRGLSGMENVMLSIAGGVVAQFPATQPTGTIIVNPATNGPATPDAYVDTKQIGLAGAYFVPPKNFLKAQTNDGQQVGVAGHTDAEGVDQLPDLIDAHGAPLLAWVEDESAAALPISPLPPNNRTLTLHHATGATAARFYWASNAAFLQATSLGKRGRDQTLVNPDVAHSLIGGGIGDPQAEEMLEAFLGNPNFPWVDPSNPTGQPTFASAGRSGFIIQSAGRDGFYFGSKDRGAKLVTPYPLPGDRAFTAHFMPPGGNWPNDRWKDKNGNVTTDDLLKDFDDLVATASN